MQQTPAHEIANLDLLSLIPPSSRRIVDVGCMLGQMAKAHKRQYPAAFYIGIDIDPSYAAVAAQHCDWAFSADIEQVSDRQFADLAPADCWIFGDCLEHLRDPWAVLRRIRAVIPVDGCVLVCIPNAQHWGLQIRLLAGQFRYENEGLLDRTHLRWFTRITALEMFAQTGWKVAQGFTRNLPVVPQQAAILEGLRAFARTAGVDPELAATDAQAFQYVFKLIPA